MASVSIPACTMCHKNLALPGNKPNPEFPETTVVSDSCRHVFHRTCLDKLFGKKKAIHCPNKNCLERFEVIDRDLLKEVHFDSVASSVAMLEGTIDGYKSLLKENNTKVTKLINDARKFKQDITITQSQLESVKNQNLLLVDQVDKLQSKNNEYIETINKLKLQKSNAEVPKQTAKTVYDISANSKTVNLTREELLKMCGSKSKIKTDNLDENMGRVKVNYDNKNKDIRKNIEKKPELPKVRYTIPRKIVSERNIEAKNDTEFIEVIKNQLGRDLEEDNEQRYQSPLYQIEKEVLPRHIQHVHRLKINSAELRKQREAERALNRENRHSEAKKRTLDEEHEREHDYGDGNEIKRHSLSPQPESYLSPFHTTCRKFGPFSQVMYRGEFAYTSGEYLLLGDGVIYGVLRTSLRFHKLYDNLLKSPYYFPRKSIRKLDSLLATLPRLPEKVMISIGDIDSATSDRSFHEIKEALQSLLDTLYCKGVKKIVMIPPVKHDKWHQRRHDLHDILKSKADTCYNWDYHYMEELLDVMSEFREVIRNGEAYYYTAKDNSKLAEEITNYTAGIKDEPPEELW